MRDDGGIRRQLYLLRRVRQTQLVAMVVQIDEEVALAHQVRLLLTRRHGPVGERVQSGVRLAVLLHKVRHLDRAASIA